MTTKRCDTEVRRKQIIDAAKEIIVKYGSKNSTIRRVANNVGISEAVIYRHFKSKQDILSFLINTMDTALAEDIEQLKVQNNSSLQSLNAIISYHISAIQQRKGFYSQLLAEIISLGDKKLNNQAAEVIDRYINRLFGLIEEGIQSGELKRDINPRVGATMLFSLIHGLVNLWAVNNYRFNLVKEYPHCWEVMQRSLKK